MTFHYEHAKRAKALAKVEDRDEIGKHVQAIYKAANKRKKEFGISKTLNPKYEAHLVCLDAAGNDYLSHQEETAAVLALRECGNSLNKRKEMLASGDLSFTHDDSASDTFNQLKKFCFLSNWDISNVMRYLLVANTIMKHADSNKKRELDIIDVGCSTGTFVKFWYDNCQRAGKCKLNYLGIEVSRDSFEEARESWGHHAHIKFVNDNVIDTPLPKFAGANSTDVILLMEVIEHVGQLNARQILKDICTVLKPGGLVFISSPNPKKHLGQEFVWIDNHAYEFSISEMREELTTAGFEIVAETGWACDLIQFKKTFNAEQKKLFNSLSGLGTSFAGSVMAYLLPDEAKHYTFVARKAKAP